MRPKGSGAELEVRRRLAMRMLQIGHSQAHTAYCVGVSPSSVHRWKQMHEKEGEEGLKAKPHPGAPTKLTPQQKRQLVRILAKGPRRLGFSTDQWTYKQIAQVIGKKFRVRYHKDHIGRLVRSLD